MAGSPEEKTQGQPMSLVPALTAEAYGAAEVIPRPEVGELPPRQAQGPTQPGQTSSPAFPLRAWYQKQTRKRNSLLKLLGAFHVVLALLYLLFGSCLVSNVKGLHLVVLKSWYPFWGAASRTLCLIAHAISCFCVLAGLFVIAKDLFLESPFDFPIWTPYPSSTLHIQRLELALLCFTVLEFFLLGSTAVTVCRVNCRPAEEDDLILVQDTQVRIGQWSMGPPPSYEDATLGGIHWQDTQEACLCGTVGQVRGASISESLDSGLSQGETGTSSSSKL
ncbi:membrane-spanning 4-domains subfamily A member 10 isoform X2 [Meles meles]|uniref:membrane-spanning 4-domains subfamily A member 10 isoform X2 n=1 Tax=Meles meles TaxID=9662 RepID=UPI001E69A4AD|nr:membrane-spanning 4-domains subfamily A member 10 isoform X2 [Meles meles]